MINGAVCFEITEKAVLTSMASNLRVMAFLWSRPNFNKSPNMKSLHWSLLLFLYAACVFAPLLIALATVPAQTGGAGFWYELGRAFGLVGIGLLAFQAILAARIKQIEQGWGMDLLLQVHRAMGLLAVAYLVAHPILLSAGSESWGLLFSLNQPWYIWLGRVALAILLLQVISSVCRIFIRLSFERWRILHNILGPLLVVFAFIHSGFAGYDVSGWPMGLLWFVLPIAAIGIHVWHRIRSSSHQPLSLYRVRSVRKETDDVTTLEFEPAEGEKVYDYLPGQFHFVTLRRGRDLPVEEHHFTISSSPTRRDALTSSIKASGDFTGTVEETEEGDLAVLNGPFGRGV